MKKNKKSTYFAGIDIGSTTAKVVITDKEGNPVFSRYIRHQAKTIETVQLILKDVLEEMGDIQLDLAVTGSAGMGVAEFFQLPFVQEVVASARFIEKNFPEAGTFIEIGGEDSKIIFFDDNFRPDIRMNGTCAGGTGAFIDQMAVLLDVDVSDLNELAARSTSIYPMASRCGVFAKTDLQAMLSRHIPREDIAASIFHAVAVQVVTALTRGRKIRKKIVFGGGPLTFYPGLRDAFVNLLDVDDENDLIINDHPELIPAMGTAMVRNGKPCRKKVSSFLSMSLNNIGKSNNGAERLGTLFADKTKFERWEKRHKKYFVPRINIPEVKAKELFIGIDSGSTTTKIVLIDKKGRLVSSFYSANNGDPIRAVKRGLAKIKEDFDPAGFSPNIVGSAATGYGESLIRVAFGLDQGVVETMAHYRAANYFEPDVSFILDIGGQDIKAIYIYDHAVSEIQVNEACSSGCGSFIETFASSLGYSIQEFAKLACDKSEPFDLGTRCTVFMNSKVKQALREGATVGDISAGLAYSVIKNALYKVLKLKDTNVLGDKIVVQGGTFKNPSVLRALELLLNREVIRPDISELMGAYGAALTALGQYKHSSTPMKAPKSDGFSIDNINSGDCFSRKEIRCKGCENKCTVVELTFDNGNKFYTGNRCERYFSNNPDVKYKGNNLINEQLKILFERNMEPEKKPVLTYGIPRCLNMYENFPFWCAFLTECGFRLVLSDESNFQLYEKGASTVMSENICFPAKMSHGHIFDLIEKKVDRIFYPTVVHEQEEYKDVLNTYNCPVVTGYPDLLKSAIDPENKFGIPIDNPPISFRDLKLLRKQLYLFFKQFGIKYRTVSKGVEKGIKAQSEYKEELREKAVKLIDKADKDGRTVVVLAGRPYHTDSLINHGIPNLLTDLGVDVISEMAVPLDVDAVSLKDVNVLTQWNYVNRLYASAEWITKTVNTQMVQLTSFGCGPDAVSTDEIKDILHYGGKIHTLIKMDEIANLGAVKIRLCSMLEAMKENTGRKRKRSPGRKKINRTFMKEDKKKTIIAPYFSPFYSSLIPFAFKPFGYNVEILPPQNKSSTEWGLKTINNDMCYPSILVAGDIIKAFQTGQYDPEDTAVLLTQTGGQCRASSYVSLVKKGLVAAGLENVPVIAISDKEINLQPGFEIDKTGLYKRLALGVIFTDPLAQMYLSTAVREKIPGTAKNLHDKYLSKMERGIEYADYDYLVRLLKDAVIDFNSVEISEKPIPKIGIVGEIFVKYNFFAGGNIVDWLASQGVEVAIPPIQTFFTKYFINETYDQKAFLKRSWVDLIKYRLLEMYSKYHFRQIERIMYDFRFYKKAYDLRNLAEITGEVISLANQFGEGWLLTAEIIGMLNEGIENIVCLQPFGCIANHITGKGVEKKLKEMFPRLNLLFLDLDAGASEVNLLNRLHFMVSAAREQVVRDVENPPEPRHVPRFTLPDVLPQKLGVFNNYTSLEVEKWRAWVNGIGLLEKIKNIKIKRKIK